jgi:hypothetical protein
MSNLHLCVVFTPPCVSQPGTSMPIVGANTATNSILDRIAANAVNATMGKLGSTTCRPPKRDPQCATICVSALRPNGPDHADCPGRILPS